MPLSSSRAAGQSPRGAAASRTFVPLFVSVLILMLVRAPPAGASSSAADKQARERFQAGEISFNLGKFVQALADYQAAYQLKPLPPLLFNVAQCYRNMQDYERARFFFRRYLALDPRTPNRRMVEDLISEMSRKLQDGNAAARPDRRPDGSLAAAAPGAGGSAAAPDQAAARLNLSAPASATTTDLALTTDAGRVANQPRPPIYRRWWFWAGLGALCVGATAVAIAAGRPGTPHGSLATIDGR